MKKIIVFSGAGISAESGLSTFRDSDGLWEKYKIEDVATPEAWKKNPKLVLQFYNERRAQVLKAKPNIAHTVLAELQSIFNIQIITQNVDDLHERAGSKNILHLHGEIVKARSSISNKTFPIKGDSLDIGQNCNDGAQLRPDVVWFGEDVPNMIKAEELCRDADILIIIGTSLTVYPAANILDFVPSSTIKYIVDPKEIPALSKENLNFTKEKASIGMPILANILKEKYIT